MLCVLFQAVSPLWLLVLSSADSQVSVPTRSPMTLNKFGCPLVTILTTLFVSHEDHFNFWTSCITSYFVHPVSSSYIRSSDWCDGKEVLRIQEVHASWLDGCSKVFVIWVNWFIWHTWTYSRRGKKDDADKVWWLPLWKTMYLMNVCDRLIIWTFSVDPRRWAKCQKQRCDFSFVSCFSLVMVGKLGLSLLQKPQESWWSEDIEVYPMICSMSASVFHCWPLMSFCKVYIWGWNIEPCLYNRNGCLVLFVWVHYDISFIYLYKMFTKCSINSLHNTNRCAIVLRHRMSWRDRFCCYYNLLWNLKQRDQCRSC